MDLADIGTLKSLLRRHGFRLSRSLGQNFIVDPAVCPRMAALCGAGKTSGALEIGPGVGVLTRELAARAAKVVAVELDRGLEPVLAETLAGLPNVKTVWGDVLKIDLAALLREEFAGMSVYVCANLPYYITSPVILRFLEERLPVSALTVMVQKEAAQRLCAGPGTRSCGAVSAAVRYYSEPEVLFPVPRSCFFPVPKVDSAVIRLKVRGKPPAEVPDKRAFFRVVRAAFGQRRKTAANSISAGLALPKADVAAALRQAGASPAARAEQLTFGQLARLSVLLDSEKEEQK